MAKVFLLKLYKVRTVTLEQLVVIQGGALECNLTGEVPIF